eukprot:COSAG05_NODE_6844_length_893_cov_0.842569_1_plen_46_part_00
MASGWTKERHAAARQLSESTKIYHAICICASTRRQPETYVDHITR